MHLRFPAVLLIVFLVLLSVSGGCTSPHPSSGTITTTQGITTGDKTQPQGAGPVSYPAVAREESVENQLASVQSTSPVWLEAYRMFKNIKSTEYVHPPYTDDDAAGIYRFDCLGFVDHVLMNSAPDSYREIGKGTNPSIESYAATFSKLDTKSPEALIGTKVEHPLDLKPGDICLWLKPSTLDTGHMWIIAGEPAINPRRTDEVLVRIFDSTGTVHSDDSRTRSAFKTGLGSGILGFMIDNEGDPVGLYWEGGASTSAGEKDTTIVCGRLTQ